MALGRRHLGFLLFTALGCASSAGAQRPMHPDHLPGTWHVVVAGETSGAIAEKAGIPLEDFLEINGLKRGEVLAPGRTLFTLSQPAVQPSAAETAPQLPVAPSPAPAPGKSNAPLRWPGKRK